MASEKKGLSPKTKKIINIAVDVVVAIILALALFLAICTISSKSNGYDQYTEVFGKAYLAVQSDSMKGDKEDSFARGDLITIKIVEGDEAKKLKVGDIVSFKDKTIVNGKWVINTHRIIEVNGEENNATSYVTHGDNVEEGNNETVLASEIIGVYQGKAGGIGHLFLFMNSSAGFFTCIVLPTLLIVAYFAVNLVLVIRKEKKVQDAAAVQAQADEKERIRQELLEEMQAQQNAAQAPPAATENSGNGESIKPEENK